MRITVRILVGLVGLAALFLCARAWFALDGLASEFGLTTANLVGRATVRGDIGGIFATVGLMSLWAAWKENRAYAFGAIFVIASVFAGRVMTILVDGVGPGTWLPMIVEAIWIAILAWGRAVWRKAAA